MPEQHQCNGLKAAVADPAVVIDYEPRERVVGILSPYGNVVLPPEGWSAWGIALPRQRVDFCPWCGEPFLGDLIVERVKIVWRGHGLDLCDPDLCPEDVPEEFKTDAWWKKRNIGPTSEVFKKRWRRPKLIRNPVIVGPRDPPREPWERPANLIGPEYVYAPEFPGFIRPPGHPPHMCEEMARIFDDPRNMIAYLPHVREYGIRRLRGGVPVCEQPIEIEPISHCPWCGRPLPPSLRADWEERLAELGLTPDSPDIPEEFLTETWWRG